MTYDFTHSLNVHMVAGLENANRKVASLEKNIYILKVEKKEQKVGKYRNDC